MAERGVMGMTNRGSLYCPNCDAKYTKREPGTDWDADESGPIVRVTCGTCSKPFQWTPNEAKVEKLDG